MNVDGQYNPKDVECISVENLEVLPSGADWQSRHLESERRKAEIRDRIHKQAEQIGRASCRKECRSRWSPYH